MRGPVLWQVPSGKHAPASRFNKQIQPSSSPHDTEFLKHLWFGKDGGAPKFMLNHSHVMTVVMVKDPLTWMTSMCRAHYSVAGPWKNKTTCPSLLTTPKVKVKWDKHDISEHKTLLDLWVDWNKEYYEADRSRIFVRYEDLLFDQVDTLKSLCSCAGGKLADQLRTMSDDVKSGTRDPFKSTRIDGGLTSASSRYANATERLKLFSDDDLDWMRAHNAAKSLIQKLGDFFPEL